MAEIDELRKKVAFLTAKLSEYENGDTALYYAVQKKMGEFAKILNNHNLGDINIDDKNSKTFERISAILEKCEKYALSATALGSRIGVVNNDENKDAKTPIYRITTPESMSNVLGNTAGQIS